MTQNWVTYIVSYYDRNTVDWFINRCRSLVQQKRALFFFTRLFDRGPLVILRWRLEDLSDQEVLRARLEDLIQQCPDRTLLSKEEYCHRYLPGVEVELENWLEDGTIHQGVYEPDLERYGGIVCYREVEVLFHLSCEWIARVLPELDGWQTRLRKAVELNRVLLDALQMTDEQRARFLIGVGDSWADYVGVNRSQQQDVARRTYQQVRDALQDEQPEELAAYRSRVERLHSLVSTMSPTLRITPPDAKRLQHLQADFDDFSFPRVVISLLHMNMNRIGIPIHAESACYYMLAFAYSAREEASDGDHRHSHLV